MGLTLPKTTPGWIYCIREQDYLDQTWGRYVKLGLTARTVEQRIREHQTGNPRRESSEYDIQLELMHYGEKYLHHYFAADRIGGEWFDLDNGQVMADVAPILQTLQSEMAARAADFRAWENLKNLVSSGNERAPTPAETALHEQFVAAEADYKIAEALHNVHDHNLRAMIGTHDGLEGALTLTEVTGSETLDKTAFMAMLTPAQLALCDETKTSVKGSLSLKGTLALKAANPAVDAALKAAKASVTSKPELSNLTASPLGLTPAIKHEHMLFLQSKRDLKVAEWVCLQLKAQLVAALGTDDAITGIIAWKRTEETTTSFSAKLAEEHFPNEYLACMTQQPNSVRVNVHEGRKYLP